MTDRCQIQLGVNKCKVFSVDRGNPQNSYTLNNEAPISLEYEKDFGVKVSSDVGLKKQCFEARSKANRILYRLDI